MPCNDKSSKFKSFEKAFKAGKTQLVWQWISGDLETPVSTYLKLCKNKPHCFLLESVEGGAVLGRYSVIGMDPDIIWNCSAGEVDIWHDYGGRERINEHPVDSLRSVIKESHIDEVPSGLPPMSTSGFFGYMGYDMVRLIENIPDQNPDELNIPDSILIRPSVLTIFDNVKSMICLVKPVYQHAKNTKEKARQVYDEARSDLINLIKQLENPVDSMINASKLVAPLKISSNMGRKTYKKAVKKAIDYIRKGEVFQVVPGQSFSVDFDLPAIELYRSLRRLNPSPFMFYLSFENFSLVGSSPEILVRVRDGTVTVRPIAGTRRRGATPSEDRELANDLLSDPKEKAEHLMLLDLARNDVGKVSEFGSVNVTDQNSVEYYSHVMHIVSNVEGKLKADLDIVDALFAGFPAGTVSGAPKVRAMEIIDELEAGKRGYYGGCVGYFSGNGELDTCIALRTALVKDGKIHVQAGAGIVADSNPESEYRETISKSQAIISAAEMAIEQAQNMTQMKYMDQGRVPEPEQKQKQKKA